MQDEDLLAFYNTYRLCCGLSPQPLMPLKPSLLPGFHIELVMLSSLVVDKPGVQKRTRPAATCSEVPTPGYETGIAGQIPRCLLRLLAGPGLIRPAWTGVSSGEAGGVAGHSDLTSQWRRLELQLRSCRACRDVQDRRCCRLRHDV